MKIAVSAAAKMPEAQVDPRFGRCNCFAIVDVQQGQWEFLPNPGVSAGGGAGIHAAQELVNRKVGGVLTGQVGPNAVAVLQAAGIEVYTGVSGTVRKAVELYRQGELSPATAANAMPHEGMKMKRK